MAEYNRAGLNTALQDHYTAPYTDPVSGLISAATARAAMTDLADSVDILLEGATVSTGNILLDLPKGRVYGMTTALTSSLVISATDALQGAWACIRHNSATIPGISVSGSLSIQDSDYLDKYYRVNEDNYIWIYAINTSPAICRIWCDNRSKIANTDGTVYVETTASEISASLGGVEKISITENITYIGNDGDPIESASLVLNGLNGFFQSGGEITYGVEVISYEDVPEGKLRGVTLRTDEGYINLVNGEIFANLTMDPGEPLPVGYGLVYDDAQNQIFQAYTSITSPIPLSDYSTALTTGIKWGFRFYGAFVIQALQLCVITASSSGIVQVDILKNGVSIFTTLIQIDENETSSTTASTAYVFATNANSFAANDLIQFQITAAGTGAAGLTCTLRGYYTS